MTHTTALAPSTSVAFLALLAMCDICTPTTPDALSSAASDLLTAVLADAQVGSHAAAKADNIVQDLFDIADTASMVDGLAVLDTAATVDLIDTVDLIAAALDITV